MIAVLLYWSLVLMLLAVSGAMAKFWIENWRSRKRNRQTGNTEKGEICDV